jgi:hypothetical protein
MRADEGGLRPAKYWSDRAEQARAMAGQFRDRVAKALMIDVAENYERMAAQAARREARHTAKRPVHHRHATRLPSSH